MQTEKNTGAAGRKGRPKKDGISVNYYIQANLVHDLDNYCELTGLTKTQAVEKALQMLTYPYKADNGKPVPAVYLKGGSKYERIAARYEGRDPLIEEEPCFVLGKTTIMDAPYYRIVKDGQIMKVPEEEIKIMQ